MKKQTLFKVISLLGIIALISGIVFTNISCKKEPEVYKIGAILPLTGPAASFGQTNQRGIELAIKDLNRKKAKFELVLEDGKSSPKESIMAFRKLTQAGVKTTITSLSGVALALAPIADREEIILFADVAHPKVTGISPFVFRHSNVADQEAEVLGNYITDKLKLASISVLYVNDDYGLSFQQCLQKYLKTHLSRTEIIASLSFEKTEMDFRDIVQKILRDKPEGVVICGYGKPIGIAIKRLKEYGFTGRMLSTMGFVISSDAALVAGDAADGLLYNDFDIDVNDPQYVKLKNEYFKRYNEEMPTFVAVEYNTTMLLAYAIEHAGYNPSEIADYLKKLGTFESAGEVMEITSEGDVRPPLKIKKYQK